MRKRKLDARRLKVLVTKDLRDLLRDRKVLFAALILPALIFPFLLAFSGNLMDRPPGGTEPGNWLRIGLVGDSALLDRLVIMTKRSSWAKGGSAEDILNGQLDTIITDLSRSPTDLRFGLLYDKENPRSLRAAKIMRRNIEQSLSFPAANGEAMVVPRAYYSITISEVDLAPIRNKTKAQVPRFLPMLFVLILISAASFAVLDLFPGERERGTLETLLVHPISMREVILGKSIAVFLVGLCAILMNMIGILCYSSLGLGGFSLGMSVMDLVILALLAIPLIVLMTCALVRVIARANTVREGQHYLLPLAMFSLLPAFLAGSPIVPFDLSTALIPITGAALAFREASLGNYPAIPIVAMVLSTLGYGIILLRGSMRSLRAQEDLFFHKSRSRSCNYVGRCYCLVMFSIVSLYAMSPFFMSLPSMARVTIPLLLFVAAPTLLGGRWVGMPAEKILKDKWPGLKDLGLSISTGLGLALMVTCISTLQKDLLPIPEVFAKSSTGLLGSEAIPLPLLLLCLAVLPAIMEELLFRRVFLTRLLGMGKRDKAVLISSFFFAAQHLSIYRFLPTFCAGIALAYLVIQTKRFWTAPIAHALSNALILVSGAAWAPLAGGEWANFLFNEEFLGVRLPLAIFLICLPGLKASSSSDGELATKINAQA